MDSGFDKYLNIPFVDRGRDLNGLDCWGLIMILYKDMFKINLPDFPISANDVDNVSAAMNDGVSSGKWVKVESLMKIGDIVAMALCPSKLRVINHVGFYIGGDQFIHVIQNQRTAICRMSDIYWRNRIKGAYRWQT